MVAETERGAAGIRRSPKPPSVPPRSSDDLARDRAERVAQLADQFRERRAGRHRPAHNHDRSLARRRGPRDPVCLSKPTTNPISPHRPAYLPTHREPDSPRHPASTPQHDHRRSFDAPASPENCLELGACRQSLAPREPPGQTVSRFRPLARRRFKTFRPPLVFIRSRKPCVLARRRSFGWYVRFTDCLLASFRGVTTAHHARAHRV
jgi:hypothetical protein